MRRADDNTLARWDLDPAIRRATTSKDQRMHAIPLDHRQFKIAAKRRR
jgi:hypothetical protein